MTADTISNKENVKSDILRKIEKLLAMSTSNNAHEAEIFMGKAMAMMTEHKITMQMVKQASDIANNPYMKKTTGGETKLATEFEFIHSILQEFFHVKIVISGTKEKKVFIHYIGKDDDIALAEYIYAFLSNQYKRLWNYYKAVNGADNKDKKMYYLGLLRGIQKKMRDEKNRIECEKGALVIYDEEGLNNAAAEHFGRLKSVKAKPIKGSHDAFSDGFDRGGKINLNSGFGRRV